MYSSDPGATPRRETPRKRHHYIRWILAGPGALLFAVISVAGCSGGKAPVSPPSSRASATASPLSQTAMFTDPAGTTCAAIDEGNSGYCPGGDPAPATPAVNPATKVTFTVTGTGDPSITYGADSDNRDGGGTLGELGDGNATPWSRSLPFSGEAQYYFMNAQLEGTGDISCKIVVTGPGDDPLTVASGHARGGYSICSAQAAPSDSTGTSWQDEG
jgi:hypothetical protein